MSSEFGTLVIGVGAGVLIGLLIALAMLEVEIRKARRS